MITEAIVQNYKTSNDSYTSHHIISLYMKYVKGPGQKKTPKKTDEKKDSDGVSEQLTSTQIVNEQDQEQITNNPQEETSGGSTDDERKPDFPKELN